MNAMIRSTIMMSMVIYHDDYDYCRNGVCSF
jgi:hypothetical protein